MHHCIGMGFFEGTVAGSAYNGELLSSRCQLKKSMHKHNQHDHASAGAAATATTVDEEIHTSCGKDFAAVLVEMMKKAEYTGEHTIALVCHTLQLIMGDCIRRIVQTVHASLTSHHIHASISSHHIHASISSHHIHVCIDRSYHITYMHFITSHTYTSL